MKNLIQIILMLTCGIQAASVEVYGRSLLIPERQDEIRKANIALKDARIPVSAGGELITELIGSLGEIFNLDQLKLSQIKVEVYQRSQDGNYSKSLFNLLNLTSFKVELLGLLPNLMLSNASMYDLASKTQLQLDSSLRMQILNFRQAAYDLALNNMMRGSDRGHESAHEMPTVTTSASIARAMDIVATLLQAHNQPYAPVVLELNTADSTEVGSDSNDREEDLDSVSSQAVSTADADTQCDSSEVAAPEVVEASTQTDEQSIESITIDYEAIIKANSEKISTAKFKSALYEKLKQKGLVYGQSKLIYTYADSDFIKANLLKLTESDWKELGLI